MKQIAKVNESTGSRPTPSEPGWLEIAAGCLGLLVFGVAPAIFVSLSDLDSFAKGLVFAGLSGIGPLAGSAAAYLLRVRSLQAFGVRPSTMRWHLIGAAAGILTFVLKGFAVMAYSALTGDVANPQGTFAEGASNGVWTFVLVTVLIACVVPFGEEVLFRGVITTVLLQYGALVGVVCGALIFALFHGLNVVFPAALVGGLAAGEIYRRCGSIWPGVTLHVVLNIPTIPVLVLTGAAQ